MKGISQTILVAILVLILSGCTVGPDYRPPDTHPPAKWHSPMHGGLTSEKPDIQTLARWWTTLGDPLLTNLEERAVKGNLDLKKAKKLMENPIIIDGRNIFKPGDVRKLGFEYYSIGRK